VRILQLRLNEFARVRFVRGGLLVDQIQVKTNFVPDPGPRSGSALSSCAQAPALASNTGGMSDLLEPLGVEAGGRQARAHYGKSFTEASAAAALDDAYQAGRNRGMGSGTA